MPPPCSAHPAPLAAMPLIFRVLLNKLDHARSRE